MDQVPPDTRASVNHLQLSPAEIEILQQCRGEAIFKRGLPFGTAAAAGHYFMMKNGLFRKGIGGVIFSGCTGFLLGTISYKDICMEKLLSLPNSTLKDRLLAIQDSKRQVSVDVNTGDGFFDSLLPSSDTPRQDSSLDIEPYSHQSDIYDSRSMNAENAYALNPPLEPPGKSENYTSYNDLRRRNREDYIRSGIPSERSDTNASSSWYSPPLPSQNTRRQGFEQSYGAPSSRTNRQSEYARPPEETPDHQQSDEFR